MHDALSAQINLEELSDAVFNKDGHYEDERLEKFSSIAR